MRSAWAESAGQSSRPTRPRAMCCGGRRLKQHGLVRKLVRTLVGRARGKVPGDEPPHGLDGADRPALKLTGAELTLDLPAHLVPLRLRNARCDPTVRHYLHDMVRH